MPGRSLEIFWPLWNFLCMPHAMPPLLALAVLSVQGLTAVEPEKSGWDFHTLHPVKWPKYMMISILPLPDHYLPYRIHQHFEPDNILCGM
jgi:hypothetical protein